MRKKVLTRESPRLATVFAVICCVAAYSNISRAQAIQIVGGASDARFSALAQSNGALDVTTSTTITLPDDGVLAYTGITVSAGGVLTFAHPDGLNPPVRLLSTGPVQIDGLIKVDGEAGTTAAAGKGGPGGFDGGSRGAGGQRSGRGKGPGGGAGGTEGSESNGYSVGHGSYATDGTPADGSYFGRGQTYGTSSLIPVVGGSGGGGFDQVPGSQVGGGGGGGGGAILIVSDVSVVVNGEVSARGGAGGSQVTSSGDADKWNGGSGGAIRIVAPKVTIPETGLLSVDGAIFYSQLSWRSGDGRIRIDAIDKSEIEFASAGTNGFTNFGYVSPSIGSNLVGVAPSLPQITLTNIGNVAVPASSGFTHTFTSLSVGEIDIVASLTNVPVGAQLTLVLTPEYSEKPDPVPSTPVETRVIVEIPVTQAMVDVDSVTFDDVPVPPNTKTTVTIWMEGP